MPFRARSRGLFRAGNGLSAAATQPLAWAQYWDISDTSKWTGAIATGQNPTIGTLNLKAIDLGGDMSTINGLTCLANTGGFNSARREWGTDASLSPTEPYFIACVYQIISGTGDGGHMSAIGPSSGGGTIALASGTASTGTQMSATRASTITASGAASNFNQHVGLVVVNGTNSKLYRDAALVGSGTLGSAESFTGKRFLAITSRSGDGSGGASGQGQVGSKWGEGGYGTGVPPEADVIAWMTAMKVKWGI